MNIESVAVRASSRSLFCGAMVATLLVTGAPAPAQAQDAHTELRLEAARNNPALRSAAAAWRAELARADAAGKLPDPRVTYGNFVAPVETRVGPQQHQVALTQTFPWFGSLGRERDAAASAAETARARLHETWLDVELRLARSLHELHRVDGLLAIERDALELLGQFEAVARARLRVNAVGSADLLRLQVELGRTEDRVRQLEDLRAPVIARIDALLDRPSDRAFATTPPLGEWPSLAPLDSLEARMLAGHPRLVALRAEAERQARLADVARDRGRPDFTLGVVHTFVGDRDDADVMDEGSDATLATVSINVPLWRGKVDAAVRSAHEQRAARESAVHTTANELRADLARARYEFDDASRRVELYERTLVPKAEESLGATLDAYANGAADFGELIDVEQTLLEFQRHLLQAHVDRVNARAWIASLVPDPSSLRFVLTSLEESR